MNNNILRNLVHCMRDGLLEMHTRVPQMHRQALSALSMVPGPEKIKAQSKPSETDGLVQPCHL